MQPQPTDPYPQSNASWFIDQWLQGKLEMTTPPTSRGRTLSPGKRRRLNSAAEDAGSGDSEKITSGLRNFEKPIYFPAFTAFTQLPADTQELYERLVDITNPEKIMPLSIRDDIHSITSGRYQSARFYHDQGMFEEGSVTQKRSDSVASAEGNLRVDDQDTARAAADDLPPPNLSYSERRRRRRPSPRAVALTELDTIVDLAAAANNCRVLGRQATAWNLEVHYPLFRLALDRPEYAHVLAEPVAHAPIAPPFLPCNPALGRWPGETVDSTRLDFVLALFVDSGLERELYGWVGRQREMDPALGEAIREAVREVPVPLGINQLAYDPLRYSPIAIGVETRTASLEDGRRQLGVYTAAWHRRMEHEWRLSFTVDREDTICDYQDILTDMTISNTRTVTGMYMIIAALRELAKLIGTHFRD
ncbi:hypothetical protein CHGG_06239 [Chaetomium globosum CBS 148.51]|uniref:PD-(D/E)XK nuclease-like domain-containing protein n=1 Tax=Chaetomium globosum (strain ATCC 6205 / CBS 148.51 / DSM 1962 / NBRC 6347 / NRRL 1970) TaxID=306901 RepID=Q2H526_CHAGB|nr:uncharacterized protein CHGG_06239 [Chaetomium globosum CBS 148.51]EAQ89620.1 hypothetical protein CHGG_06239 [Chaetomium globosum CBS 148.51]